MRKINAAIASVFLLMSACSPQRFFYYPNRILYVDPDKVGLHPELVNYPSANGKLLSALYFKTDLKPRGTIVHFHGNYGNVSSHFPLSLFLLKYGYDVLAFDYQGYGVSEGSPSPTRLVEDGIASVHWAQAHLRDPKTGVAIFGQSLGGAVAAVVAAKEPLVRAAVIESAFSRHAAMARTVLGRHIITWPLYLIVPLFVNHSLDPVKHVKNISPRAVLFIHGDADKIVPVEMSYELYGAALEPKKIWVVQNAGHLEIRKAEGKRYETTISDFFGEALR